MTARRTEQDSVAVEPHCPPAWPVRALEQEPLAVPRRSFPHRTPHGGDDLESLPDSISRECRVEGPGLPYRILGIPPVHSSLDRLHPLPEADSVVRGPGPHLLARGGRAGAGQANVKLSWSVCFWSVTMSV
jgi:hypothetical protein